MQIEISRDQQLVYLTRRRGEIVQLKEKLDAQDFEFLKMVGHRLKGNGETFGFPDIAIIGRRMEEAVKASDLEVMHQIVSALEQSVEHHWEKVSSSA